MGRKYSESELFTNAELEFTFGGQEYLWRGDYEINQWGELEDWDSPGDGEVEVVILTTEEVLDEDGNNVEITREMEYEIESIIEKNL